MRPPDYNRRVAVTGLGVISPIGNDKATAWDALLNGRSGLAEITYFDVSRYEAKAAGEVKGFNPLDWLDAKQTRRTESSQSSGLKFLTSPAALASYRLTSK